MKSDDLLILAAAGVAAWWILTRYQTASAPRRVGRLEVPALFTSGGGWLPDGSYDARLLDRQYSEGWGYGD